MGRLIYGARGVRIEMDDLLLAHLQMLTIAKLRRGEPFLLSWVETIDGVDRSSSIWMTQNVDLLWEYEGLRPTKLDPQQLETMATQAASNGGLNVGEEAHNPPVESTTVSPAS
ncbi:MAG TPA: ATP-dependent DNA ligase [Pseudolysinimonas sp.]|jgi:hypothetical protein